MSESIRSNFKPGRWLLVSGVMLSVVLMLQLYAINETVDVSSIDNIIGENYIGLFLIASYLLTMIAMITVVIEYFSVRKKVDGLLALTEILNLIEDLQYPAKPVKADAEDAQMPRSRLLGLEDDFFEPESLKGARTMDPLEQAYAALDDGERAPDEDEEHGAVEVKIMVNDTEKETDHPDESMESSEPGPLSDADIIKRVEEREHVEGDEDDVEGMLQQSEVISTLSELERVVEELRTKKPKSVAT